MEVGGDGGVETGFGAEVVGNEAGEVIVAAVAEGAGAAGDLVVAVTVGGVEGMGGVDGFGSGDGAAFRAAAEGGGRGDGGGGDAEAVADEEGEFSIGEKGSRGDK